MHGKTHWTNERIFLWNLAEIADNGKEFILVNGKTHWTNERIFLWNFAEIADNRQGIYFSV